jgi:hypothetical protein
MVDTTSETKTSPASLIVGRIIKAPMVPLGLFSMGITAGPNQHWCLVDRILESLWFCETKKIFCDVNDIDKNCFVSAVIVDTYFFTSMNTTFPDFMNTWFDWGPRWFVGAVTRVV